MEGKPRMGRPPSPRDRVRRNRIVTYVTDSDLARLEQAAEKSRSSLSSLVYQYLQHTLETERQKIW